MIISGNIIEKIENKIDLYKLVKNKGGSVYSLKNNVLVYTKEINEKYKVKIFENGTIVLIFKNLTKEEYQNILEFFEKIKEEYLAID